MVLHSALTKSSGGKAAVGMNGRPVLRQGQRARNARSAPGARAVAGINDLNTLKPGLASEWSKKNEIKPTEVTVGSHKKVIWKCRLGHEWTASVKSRSINGSGCPYCSHNKVLVGFNDLATVVPKVADLNEQAEALFSRLVKQLSEKRA